MPAATQPTTSTARDGRADRHDRSTSIDSMAKSVSQAQQPLIAGAREAGNAYLDSYEKIVKRATEAQLKLVSATVERAAEAQLKLVSATVERAAEAQLKLAGATQGELIKNITESQADLARELTSAYMPWR
ncbi:MAG: hypothetical protein JOZ07_00245 [Solirubrobacterales bacterium]|nr:hypothetical protein [Solirubrobacterales bacterium]